MADPKPTDLELEPRDLAHLARLGIEREEAERQLALLRRPPGAIRIERPCTAGDGILVFGAEAQGALEARFSSSIARRRLVKFVPASGAASRMFAAVRHPGRERERLLAELDRLPFEGELAEVLAEAGADLEERRRSGSADELVDLILGPAGLDLAAMPKGLIPFHRGPDGRPRTAVEEQMREAAGLFPHAPVRLHFTVSPDHRAAFESRLEELQARLGAELGTRFELELSEQSPATDTLAAELDGRPFRQEDGTLLLRPGGHGALIRNVAELVTDLVLMKNIDNILPAGRQQVSVRCQRLLLGLLLELETEQHALQRALGEADAAAAPPDLLAQAKTFLERLGRRPDELDLATALDLLQRPLRVCAVVPNAGEPGGGPFWVRDGRGQVAPQIVETSQIDSNDPGQAAHLAAATHFNPVLVAGSLRDAQGLRYPLERFVEPDASFLSRKSAAGRELVALERPGLWNGAMAGWLTAFVEVAGSTFAPVKTVLDLLRPEHQEGSAA